jgi:hypothetical protein
VLTALTLRHWQQRRLLRLRQLQQRQACQGHGRVRGGDTAAEPGGSTTCLCWGAVPLGAMPSCM